MELRESARDAVVVASDHRLVGEALRAALESRGVTTRLLAGWPGLADPRIPMPRGERGADVLLVVCELDVAGRAGEARAIGLDRGLPWVVLTQGSPSALWGSLLDAGAAGVLGPDLGLDDLVEVITLIREGRSPMNDVLRRSVLRDWHAGRRVPEPLLHHLEHLTAQERELLTLLYEGATLKAVAARYGISEAAARAQVQVMLRRLARV